MNLNATLFAQLVVFFVLAWVTMKFVWPPLMKAIDERAQKIADGLAAADKAKTDLALAEKRATEELRHARESAAELRGGAEKQASQLVDEARAEAFRHRVQDVSLFLAQLGWRQPTGSSPKKLRVAYHDACHLANAQGVRAEPRALLASIPGLELLELPDAHLCCGSAGTYNLDQPAIAAGLGAQKARAIIATGAEVLASGNIGCLTQLDAHLQKLGSPVRVRHTMQILRDAYPPR